MNELKKYAAIGGAVVLVACWPFATGKIGEAIFKDGIASYHNGIIEVEPVFYDRGYLSSQAQSRIHVIDQDLSQELEHAGYPTEILVNHDISHGLFSVSSVSKFVSTGDTSEFIQGLTLTTDSKLTGTTDLLLTSQDTNFATTDLQAQGVEKLFLAAAELSATIEKDGQFSLSYQLPKTELRLDNQSAMIVDNVAGQSVGHYIDDIFIGEADIALDKLALSDAESNSHNEIKGLKYTSVNQLTEVKDKVEENSFTTQNRLTLEEALTDAGVVKNGVFDISFENLNFDGLKVLVPLLQEQELTNENVEKLLLSFDLLAAKGFNVNINEFSAEVLGSKLNSNILLTLPAGTARASQNADQLIKTVTGSTELVIAKKLVDETPELRMQMDELLINEFAIEDGDNYRLAATISDGQIELLNGQKMPLFMLLGFLSYLQ
ncbi:MAG: YdgA family protein [Aliivibrio sp.]|nr:YdgA family protein [Aliivibrio sp.]